MVATKLLCEYIKHIFAPKPEPPMPSKQDIENAKQSLLFKNAPGDLAQNLLETCVAHSFPRGTTIFIQGDNAEHMFVVLEGWIKLTRITPAGDEVIVSVYSKGQSFGEAAALKNGLYPVTAVAVTDCRLMQVKSQVMLDTLKTNPELAAALLGSTFQHLHELVMQVQDIKALSGVQRLAAFLLGLAPVNEGSCTFSLPYDKNLIAGRLGMKPESLSRAFARLRDIGVVVSRNNVAISDIERLHDLSEDDAPHSWKVAGH